MEVRSRSEMGATMIQRAPHARNGQAGSGEDADRLIRNRRGSGVTPNLVADAERLRPIVVVRLHDPAAYYHFLHHRPTLDHDFLAAILALHHVLPARII